MLKHMVAGILANPSHYMRPGTKILWIKNLNLNQDPIG